MAFVETANFETKEAKGSGFLDVMGGLASFAAPIVTGALTGGASSLLGNVLSGATNEAVKAGGGNIPQMMLYNGGGTHEQNPMGGIPVDQFGNPSLNASALVEQGEVGYKLPNDKSGYVFSNRIKYPGSKHTFADEAKKITSKYKNRLGKDLNKPDTLAKQAMDMAMEELKNKQELIKNEEMVANQIKAYGSYIKAKGGGLPKYDGLTTDTQQLPNNDAANYLKGSGYKEAMLGYGIQGLTRLPQLFTSPESISYDRVNPELVDFAQERGSMETSRNNQLGFLKRQAGMAGNAGQALNYLASAVPSAYNQYDQQYAQSIEREQNTNAQIMNQANAQNAQIQMREAEANAMERDAARSIRDQALSDIGNIGLGAMMTKPNLMNQYNTLKAQGLIGDYDISWNADGSPNITRKRDKAPTTAPPTVPSSFTSVQARQSYNPMLSGLGLNPNFGNTLTGANNPLMGKKLVPGLDGSGAPLPVMPDIDVSPLEIPDLGNYQFTIPPVTTPPVEMYYTPRQQQIRDWLLSTGRNPDLFEDYAFEDYACGGNLKKCKGGYIKKKGKK